MTLYTDDHEGNVKRHSLERLASFVDAIREALNVQATDGSDGVIRYHGGSAVRWNGPILRNMELFG